MADQTRLGPDNAALVPHRDAVADPVRMAELSFVNSAELLASLLEALVLHRAPETLDVPPRRRGRTPGGTFQYGAEHGGVRSHVEPDAVAAFGVVGVHGVEH